MKYRFVSYWWAPQFPQELKRFRRSIHCLPNLIQIQIFFTSGFPSSRRLSAPRHRDHLPGGPGDPQGGPEGSPAAGLRGSDEVLQGQHSQDLSQRGERQAPDGRGVRCQTQEAEQGESYKFRYEENTSRMKS